MSKIIPGYSQGWIRNRAKAEYPNLWEGLVGAWSPSLGPTGGTLYDHSGYGNHGTLTDMDPATDWISTPHGWALSFDGSNDYINVGNVSVLDITKALTICTMARAAANTVGAFAQKVSVTPTDQGYWFGYGASVGTSAGTLYIRINSSGTANTFTTTPTYVDNVWRLFVGIFRADGSTHPEVWVDGIQAAGSTSGSAKTSIDTTTNPFYIAHHTSGGSRWLNADLAFVYVYNRAFSVYDVSTLHASMQ